VNISAPFIHRPIGTSLLAVGVLLLGLLGLWMLPIAALPMVDFPIIQVTTALPGASPEIMAAAVTAPLERRLSYVPGLVSMSSIVVSPSPTTKSALSRITRRHLPQPRRDSVSAQIWYKSAAPRIKHS